MGNKLYYIQHNSKAKIFDGITLIISQKIYHSYFVQSQIIIQGRLLSLTLNSSNINPIHIIGIYVNANNSEKDEIKHLLQITLNTISKIKSSHNIA